MTTYIGTVTWYNKRKGYGFVKCQGKVNEDTIVMSEKDCPVVNKQYFVHVSDIQTRPTIAHDVPRRRDSPGVLD